MNKNPEIPKNMDNIMSSIFNPNYKKFLSQDEKYWENQKKIKEAIFEK